jgi:hypothetical protein
MRIKINLKNSSIMQVLIGLTCLAVFIGIFSALQNKKVYLTTLGKFSKNYENTLTNEGFQIKQVSKPYQKISNENLEK